MVAVTGIKPAFDIHALTSPYDRLVVMTTRKRTFKHAPLEWAAIEPRSRVSTPSFRLAFRWGR